jgi:hypothetical protein
MYFSLNCRSIARVTAERLIYVSRVLQLQGANILNNTFKECKGERGFAKFGFGRFNVIKVLGAQL